MKKLLFSIMAVMISTAGLYAAKGSEKYIADLNPSSEESVIIEATKKVIENKDKSAEPALIGLLGDERDKVRLNAAVALGYAGSGEASESLNRIILEDKKADVRYAAVLSLVRIGSVSSESVETLYKAKETDSDPFIVDFLTKLEKKLEEYK